MVGRKIKGQDVHNIMLDMVENLKNQLNGASLPLKAVFKYAGVSVMHLTVYPEIKKVSIEKGRSKILFERTSKNKYTLDLDTKSLGEAFNILSFANNKLSKWELKFGDEAEVTAEEDARKAEHKLLLQEQSAENSRELEQKIKGLASTIASNFESPSAISELTNSDFYLNDQGAMDRDIVYDFRRPYDYVYTEIRFGAGDDITITCLDDTFTIRSSSDEYGYDVLACGHVRRQSIHEALVAVDEKLKEKPLFFRYAANNRPVEELGLD